ncbi:hypothetical protein [Magnetospirillum aberrantis]|uniref:Uncharacterized protein n=1 Tax=Magnetospirillum aberrantis SpK TaxID=908842 RepID=A0A7C9QV84_9PROT|nr:hypothetical protein [Magnetospirillum aberrantis]NFV81404.1 hypothetical protein [Magnetospirillum aberrantis SpK]
MDGELALNLMFWPLAILATHSLYIRNRHHPAWTPWKATATFLWNLAWPTILVLAGVVGVVFAIGGTNLPGLSTGLAPVITLGALIPIFLRAKRIILAPPGHRGPIRDGEATGWDRAAEQRLEKNRTIQRTKNTHRLERMGMALGRTLRGFLRPRR